MVQFNRAENNVVLIEEKLPQNELKVEFESMHFILVAIKKIIEVSSVSETRRRWKNRLNSFYLPLQPIAGMWVTGRVLLVY